jgi:hypothetical protein
LCEQLNVGVVPVAGHAVGDNCREHAFERRQYCNRKGRRDQRQNVLGVKIGEGKGRQTARDPAESAADGLDR